MLRVLKASLEELERKIDSERFPTPETQALALWAVRERELYKPEFKTFEDYLNRIWEKSLSFGLKLIGLVEDSVGQYGNMSKKRNYCSMICRRGNPGINGYNKRFEGSKS